MSKLSLLFILTFIFPIFSTAQTGSSKMSKGGLFFYSYDQPKEKRTSLHIPLEKILSKSEGQFSLNFDFKIRTHNQNYGYVFRILAKNQKNLDLVIPDFRVEGYISLIFYNKTIIRIPKNNVPHLDFDTWNHANLSFNGKTISFSLNGRTQTARLNDDFSPLDIFFGANKNIELSSSDVPPMTLKNIKLLDGAKREIRFWSLVEHGKDVSYDVYEKDKAYVTNPKWEIDSHYHWQKKKTFTFEMFPQIAFDKDNEKVYIAQRSSMLVYDLRKDKLDTIDHIRGNPYDCLANQMIYDGKNKQLISYNFSSNSLALYNFKDKQWDNAKKEKVVPHFWHHSRYFNPGDSTLNTVGGYGYFKYKGLLMQYSLLEKKWKQTNISKSITPRYLGSLGHLEGDKLLYFGGYGSESGNQEESPKNHYDLFQIETRTHQIKKLWEKKIKVGESHYTNGNSMVVDKGKGIFYILSYPNSLNKSFIQAKEFKITTGEEKLVGNTIPYFFNDNRSFCDLFYGSRSGKLIAITAHTDDSKHHSNINIYTIDYSPYSASEIFQQEEQAPSNHALKIAVILCIILSAAIALFAWKFKKTNPPLNSLTTSSNTGRISFDLPKNEVIELMPSSVNLIGGFQVIDKQGLDITKDFSPTVKHLFLLILLSSLSKRKRITSSNLKDVLWFDKDDNSARNNRNVNLSKLRLLLQRVGDIEVQEENNSWSVSYQSPVFCDYQTVLSICKEIKSEKELNRVAINDLISLSMRGKILSDINTEWVDSYKSEYTLILIETLVNISVFPAVGSDYELLYRIGEAILLQDSIDENGLRLKCYGLYHLNHKGEALKCFHKFCEEYRRLLVEDYKVEFTDLIKKSNI